MLYWDDRVFPYFIFLSSLFLFHYSFEFDGSNAAFYDKQWFKDLKRGATVVTDRVDYSNKSLAWNTRRL